MTTAIRGAAVAPAPLNVGQTLLRYLALEGVDKVFGVPGGGLANLLVVFKDERAKVEYIVCRQETGAAYIADGYYRTTGKLGVVMVTSGPGATNALTGTMSAQSGGSAMLTITGEVAEAYLGKGYLQEGMDTGLNIDAIYTAATATSAVIVDASDFQTLFEQALRDALSIPRHAVHISMPNNVSAEPVPNLVMPKSPASYRATPQGAPRELACQTLKMLLSASKPLVFLGSGSREALRNPATLSDLTFLLERYGIPVMTTADGKGVFPETHELSLRNYGFSSCMWPSQWMAPKDGAPYDGLLVIGSALRGLATNNWNAILLPKGPFIQVDLDQTVIGRSMPITLGVVAEAGAFIREMRACSTDFPPDERQAAQRKQVVREIKQQSSPFLYPKEYDSDAAPIEPGALVRVLQGALPKDAIIMLDSGNCVSWGVNCFVVDPPMQIHSSLAMGPMGFGVGAVVGAKIGQPDRTCIALVGDGAFMMHGAEVSTARHYNVGAIWVVLYDDDLHMVTQGQEYYFADKTDPRVWADLYRLGNPDLAQFAQGLGADAYVVTSPPELEKIMPEVLAKANGEHRPQVIVAQVNRSAFSPYFPPPIPPH